MHWLPLVAMVIASALPFPHNPVSRIAAATTEPGFDGRRERRRDPAARLAAPPADYSFHGNASETDLGAAAAVGQRRDGRGPRNHGDSVKSTTHAERSTAKAEDRGTPRSHRDSGSDDKSGVRLDVPAEGGALRTEDISEHDSLQKDYKADGGSSSRQDYSSFADFSWRDNRQDPTDTAEKHNAVGSVANPEGQRGPEPTVPSEQLRDTSTFRTGIQRTLGDRGGPADESLTPEAALGQGTGPDIVLEGNEMFLDAHPRVLFSPSLSPPEHPPLLLMLETGLLEEDWYGDEQEDTDGRIEGHGDWAMDPGAALGRVDSSGVAGEVARPIKRDKRSHLMDRRRGEQSVCESESIWVTDKKTAITSDHKNVTILQEIQTQTGPLKQFFYETRCRQPEQQSADGRSRAASSPGMGVAGAGCLGVDKKQWLSECKPKQSYVRALTKDANNRTGWRWIRIDSSCVCVLLSRAKQGAGRQVLMRNGRG